MQRWWPLNNYTWNKFVDGQNAREAECRELHADMANAGWFSD